MVDVKRLPLEGEGGLIDLLQTVVDPRKRRGVRHPVVTIVAIAVCAALSGARGFRAVADWAKELSRETLKRLGSMRWTAPSEPAIRRVLQRLDAGRLDAPSGAWLLRQHCLAGQGISVDGKTLRGAHDSGQAAPHLLSAILHPEGVVVAQREVEAKTNEIPELSYLLEPLPIQGAVPARRDALHTQKDTARYLVESQQADSVFTVKDNQPPSVKTLPISTGKRSPPQHTTTDKGHGRWEVRHIWTSTELNGYLDFPYVSQVFCVPRDITQMVTAKSRTETAYGITSLGPEKADPARVLSLNRKHWSIENRIHWVRDVTFDEDRCCIRKGAGAQVMASLRNLAISLLRMAGATYIPPALRSCAHNSFRPLRWIGLAIH